MTLLEAPFHMEGHEHNFDHVTFLSGGKWRVRQSRNVLDKHGNKKFDENGEPLLYVVHDREVDATYGYIIPIPKEDHHSFDLIEGRGMYHCIYAPRDPDTGEIVQEYNFWEGAAS